MLHRHRHPDTSQWEKVDGNVLEIRLMKSPTGSAPHPKQYVVLLHPAGGEPVQVETAVDPYDSRWDNFFYASVGDVRGFVVDPSSGAAFFDLTDKRNDSEAQMAAADALMDQMLADQPAPAGEAVTGPPWVVPATCPSCGAPVDQAREDMEIEPRCRFCHQPLPAQPRAQF